MTLSTQFLTMIAMIGMGSFFGASLDTYNRFLNRGKRKRWIVFIHDVLFWIFQGLSIFYVLFLINNGELRFYIFLALLCGFAAYQSLLKNLYLHVLEKMIALCVKIYRILIQIITILVYRPIRLFITIFITISISIGKGLLTLARGIVRILLWIIRRILLWPFIIFGKICWKLLPKRMKKNILNIYNKMAGVFRKIKNKVIYILSKWKKK